MQKQTIGSQCYLTIPRSVTIIYENRISVNGYRALYKDLNEFSPSDDWLPYEYIDTEVKKKLDETKGRLAGNEMEKETKYYVEYINHDPNWLNTIIIEIDIFLIDREYINFFIQMYIQWRKDDGSTSSSQTLIIPRLPCFGKLDLSQFQLYIEAQTMTRCFVCRN